MEASRTFIHNRWKYEITESFWEKIWELLIKLDMHENQDLSIRLSDTQEKQQRSTEILEECLVAALFIIARNGNNSEVHQH